jgi:hypothetical protein
MWLFTFYLAVQRHISIIITWCVKLLVLAFVTDKFLVSHCLKCNGKQEQGVLRIMQYVITAVWRGNAFYWYTNSRKRPTDTGMHCAGLRLINANISEFKFSEQIFIHFNITHTPPPHTHTHKWTNSSTGFVQLMKTRSDCYRNASQVP